MYSQEKMDAFFNAYDGEWYLILDGAAIKGLHGVLYREDSSAESILLYYDTQYEAYSSISPCIINIKFQSPIYKLYANSQIFSENGLVFGFKGTINEIKTMLVQNMEAKMPDGNTVLFRYYDPFVVLELIRANEYGLVRTISGKADYMAWLPEWSQYRDSDRHISVYKNFSQHASQL